VTEGTSEFVLFWGRNTFIHRFLGTFRGLCHPFSLSYILGIDRDMKNIFIIVYKKIKKDKDVRFVSAFGFNSIVRICKEQHETQILEIKKQLTFFRRVYLLEPTVT
jgi:hypothetical protein